MGCRDCNCRGSVADDVGGDAGGGDGRSMTKRLPVNLNLLFACL